MANLVEVAEELEYVPKEQLIQMAQEPNSRFPSYMVLSEIQRRTQMERMYNAERMEKPTTTVAEELVGEFAQPQGLAGMAADGLATPANDFSTSAPPASPMQMAAIGGRTGYADKGRTELRERQKELRNIARDYVRGRGNRTAMPIAIGDNALARAYGDLEYKPDMNQESYNKLISDMKEDLLYQYFPEEAKKMEQQRINKANQEAVMLRRLHGPSEEEIKFSQKKGLGGRVGYQNLGATGDARLQLLTSLGIDPTGMSEAQIEDALLFASTREQEQKPLPQVNTGVDRPVDIATEEPGFFEGLYDDVSESYLGQLAKDYAKETYYDDEGDFKYGAAALDAATFIPGVGLGLGLAGKTLYKGLPAAYKYLKGIDYADKARKTGQAIDKATKPFYTAPRQVVKSKKGKEYSVSSPEGKMIQNIGGKKPYGSKTLRDVSLPRAAVTTSVGGLAAREVYDYMQSDAKATDDSGKQPSKKDLDNKIDEIVPDDKTNKGLKGKVKSYIDQADGLDIAKLGGIIMSAKNMSELGAGIAGLASDIQERRLTEDELENRKALQGLQGEYYKAQADKVQAEIEALPAEQVNSLLTQYAQYAKAINDGNITLEGEELKQFSLAYQALLDKANKLQGIETGNNQSDADLLAAAGISVSG
tara:strand:+ start:2971 stop:4914 length:1944 start_codon:yes stop_codon:yes gene_type:complete